MPGRIDWKAIYFHLVSLVAMIFILFAAGSGGQGLLRMLFPKLSMADSYEWQAVESFTAYKQQYGQYGHFGPKPIRTGPDLVDTASVPPTEEELRVAWEEHRHLAVESHKRRGMWDFLKALVTLAVAVPVLLFHRRGAKRLKPEADG